MIVFAAFNYDPNGYVVFNDVDRSTTLNTFGRRNYRQLNLDGSADIVDSGFNKTDSGVSLEILSATNEQVETLYKMVSTLPRLKYYENGEVFDCAIDRIDLSKLPLQISLFLTNLT